MYLSQLLHDNKNMMALQYDRKTKPKVILLPITEYDHENETMISIHPYLTIIGLLSSITTFIFCLCLVLVPLSTDYQGSLTYISNGMEKHCGWSGTVLGSCSLFIAVCEATAALHTQDASLLISVFIQATSWYMIMGVSDTGWCFHYFVLVIFLISTMFYHIKLSYLHPFDTFIYSRVNIITSVNIALFFITFLISWGVSEKDKWMVLDVTVSLELTLMFCLTIQNLCVIRALNQYKNIHILFERE
jgi:hypothetical protein